MSAAADLLACCRQQGLQLVQRRNRRTLVVLRDGQLTVHPELLEDAGACQDLLRFIPERGRGSYPLLKAAMQRIVGAAEEIRAAQAAADPAVAALPVIGAVANIDAAPRLEAIAATYFPTLPRPRLTWGRNSYGKISHLRFGSYRPRPSPLITLHPRLAQPWVAWAFIDHVIHHELCHHAVHLAGVRGEGPHGPSFRRLEARFSGLATVLAWERAHLARFLAG